MHTLFDVGKLRLIYGLPRDVIAAADYAPIRELHNVS
jgi:hypothetical protein